MRPSSGARSGSPSSQSVTTSAAAVGRHASTRSSSTAAPSFTPEAVREAMGGIGITTGEFRYAQSGIQGGPEGRENSHERAAAKPFSVSVPRPAPYPPSAPQKTPRWTACVFLRPRTPLPDPRPPRQIPKPVEYAKPDLTRQVVSIPPYKMAQRQRPSLRSSRL